MKRSEALKIIDDVYGKFVEDWLKADLDDLSGFQPLNERILSSLEKAGMLPPLSNDTMSQHNMSTIDAMIDSVVYDFKWDDE